MATSETSFNFPVGDRIIFECDDSDDSDDDESGVHRAEIVLYRPRTNSIQVREQDSIKSYFLDDIRIRSIEPSQEALELHSTIENVSSFDLSIFKENKYSHQCVNIESDNLIENCSALKRLTMGLKYYSLLNLNDEENKKNTNTTLSESIFATFVHEVYHNFIDDYNHLDDIHHNQLNKIQEILITSQLFKPCNIESCKYTARHHDIECEEEENEIHARRRRRDPDLAMFMEQMDALHFYLFHLFHVGLMIMKQRRIWI